MDKFNQYADYFAYALDQHREAYLPLVTLPNTILQLDDETIGVAGVNGADLANDLSLKVLSAREQIIRNFSKINRFESALTSLFKYVKDKYGYTSIDNFLTDNQIQVFNSFARASRDLGQPVSAANIKEK